ncbi:hypothetical protein CR513_17334, partial [Mucuna pruriens]
MRSRGDMLKLPCLKQGCLGLDCIKELYEKYLDFSDPFDMCVHSAFCDFLRHDGFLFKGKRLYVPMNSILQLLMNEAHKGGLMCHFGELKTFKILNKHFYWPHTRKDVSLHGLYTQFPIPTIPWIDISMDFLYLVCPGLKEVEILFLLWFIIFENGSCHSMSQDVVRLHGLPRTIVSDCDTKFLGHFWMSLWSRLSTKLLFSTTWHPQTDEQTKVALLHMEKKGEEYAKNTNKGRKEVFFKEGDLVFPHLRKSELLPKGNGPFKILKRINDNAYKERVPSWPESKLRSRWDGPFVITN